MNYFVGIDIGGTTIKYGVINDAGQISVKGQKNTVTTKSALFESMDGIIDELTQTYPVSGIGISVPGFVTKKGMLHSAGAIKGFVGINLLEELEKRFPYPIHIENDANATALAEHLLGASKGTESSVTLTIGTGVGGAIIINNELLRGKNSRAGEFGFMLIDPVSQADTKSPSLSKVAALPSLYTYYFIQANQRLEDGKRLFLMANDKDQAAQKAINLFTQKLAIGIYNLLMIIDPEIIVIGGAISENNEFLSIVKKKVTRLFQSHDELVNTKIPKIVATQLKNDAGMIGAVSPFLQKNG